MKKIVIVNLMIFSLLLVGCSTNIHTVGTGPETGMTNVARQYYLFWGLIPLNSVNTNQMARDMQAENYEIQTQLGPVDVAINTASLMVIGGLVSSRTVTVTK